MPAQQFKYYLLTIPAHAYIPWLPNEVQYLRGQLEEGNGTGYRHWQLLAIFKRKLTLTAAKRFFDTTAHLEPTRSAAANDYVWKDDTAIADTRFELGTPPVQRNSKVDWERVRDNARRGRLDDIPPDIYVRCYNQVRYIIKYPNTLALALARSARP